MIRLVEEHTLEPDVAPHANPEDACDADHLDEDGRKRDEEHRIIIEVRSSGIQAASSLAVDAMAEQGHVYQRAYRLVQVVSVTAQEELASRWVDAAGHEHFAVRAGTPLIDELVAPVLKGLIDSSAKCVKYDRRSKEWRPCAPSADMVGYVLGSKRWAGIPVLAGVSDSPILRPDGTVCQADGYDPRSGYWLRLSQPFPAIPEQPTRDQARAAYGHLADVFRDFPYTDPCMRAVPVAAILSVVGRAAIQGSIPMFMFDASAGRTGKTLQTDAVAFIATGRFAARKAYPPNDEETEKVLMAYAMAGTPLICIDDIKRPFGGEVLDMVVTSRDEVDLRILGKTEHRRVPWRAVIMGTGVNLAFLGQMAARSLVSRLESPLERPQDRDDFTIADLPAHVQLHRAELVADALTILRAYTCKGLPPQLGRWGGFDEWTRVVAEAIAYAGDVNVLGARPPDDGDVNPETDALRSIITGLAELELLTTTGKGLAASEVRQRLYLTPGQPEPITEMAEALRQLTRCKPPADPTADSIGRALRRYKGRVLGGRKLVSFTDGHTEQTRWTVQKLKTATEPTRGTE